MHRISTALLVALTVSCDPPPRLRYEHGVRTILEDRRGNYWFGGWQEGACRFDGERLTYFTQADGLTHNQVRTIQEDSKGVVWFENGFGISRWDGEQLRPHIDRDYSSKDRWELAPDALWFKGDEGTGFNELEGGPGAFRFDGEEFRYLTFPLTEFRDRSADAGYSVTGIATGKGGRVWFATYATVFGFDGESFTVFDHRSLGLAAQGGVHVRSVLEDSKGNLWIGNNGIGVLLHDGESTVNFSDQHGVGRNAQASGPTLHRVFAMGEDRDGNIWFGTYGSGAWCYDGSSLRHFGEAEGLTSEDVTAVYTDRSGDLLLGGNGVFRFEGGSFKRIL